jgi:hypothetical protein
MNSIPPSPTVPSFTLEVASQMSEADYLRWNSTRKTKSARARAASWGITVLAALCFASGYTIALGVVFGLVALAIWTAPRWMAWSSRNAYRHATYLHTPLVYGVSSTALWFRGGALRAESAWDGLVVWEVRDDSLRLSAAGMPRIILPIATLREAGIYDHVRELAARNGVEYDSPEARNSLWKPRRATAP